MLNENDIKAKLSSCGVPDKVVPEVINMLKEGITFKINPGLLDIKFSPRCRLTFFDKLKRGPDHPNYDSSGGLTSWNWQLEMEGIPMDSVREVRIPTLTYSDADLLTLDVTLYPFDLEPMKTIEEERPSLYVHNIAGGMRPVDIEDGTTIEKGTNLLIPCDGQTKVRVAPANEANAIAMERLDCETVLWNPLTGCVYNNNTEDYEANSDSDD